MRIFGLKIPKLITGGLITLAGAAISTVPVIGAAGPVIMKVGGGVMAVGALDKGVRVVKKKSLSAAIEHEKAVVDRVRGQG